MSIRTYLLIPNINTDIAQAVSAALRFPFFPSESLSLSLRLRQISHPTHPHPLPRQTQETEGTTTMLPSEASYWLTLCSATTSVVFLAWMPCEIRRLYRASVKVHLSWHTTAKVVREPSFFTGTSSCLK